MYSPLKLDINWAQERAKMEQAQAAAEIELRNTIDPHERVDQLLATAEWTRLTDTNRTGALIREAIDLARSVDYYEGWALGLSELVRYSLTNDEKEAAEQLCVEAEDLLKDNPPSEKQAFIDLRIGWMAFFFGQYSMAMEWGLKGIEIAKNLGLITLHARLLDMIACVHSLMNDHVSALDTHAKAITMAEKSGNLVIYASILNNFAMSYFEAGELEHALEMARPCVEIGRELRMTRLIQNYFDTQSEILLAMGRLDEAETVLKEALDLTNNSPMEISKSYITCTLGKIKLMQGKLDLAAEYLKQSIEIMTQFNLRGSLAEPYKLMSSVQEKQGDFARALESIKNYYMITETTAGKESARQQAKIKASYDIQLAQRDAEIERLRNFELQAEIEDRKHVQEVLEKLARTDMLTKTTNRHHFFILAEKEVERSLRYKRPLALMILDIDYFKRINDTLGHIAGDQVLVSIAQTIQTTMREIDVTGRYGGEEFCVLLPETNLNDAFQAAERLRTTIAELIVTTDKGQANVTVSIGIADLAGNKGEKSDHTAARELAILLDHADQALYTAKASGRNSTHIFGGTRSKSQTRTN